MTVNPNNFCFSYFSVILDFSIMFWAFGKPSLVINIWLVLNVMAFLVFPIFRFWQASRMSWLRLPNSAWLVFYLGYIGLFITFPIQEICSHELPPASSIIVLCEQVIGLSNIYVSSTLSKVDMPSFWTNCPSSGFLQFYGFPSLQRVNILMLCDIIKYKCV